MKDKNIYATLRRGCGIKYIVLGLDQTCDDPGTWFKKNSIWDAMTVNRWSKSRQFGLFGSLAFLGLAFCVFGWGLEYKLSLYDPPQTPSHQIPKAKLLSRDEQSSTAKSSLVVRAKTSTKVIYTAPTADFLILLLTVGLLNLPASERMEKWAYRLLNLHRAILNTLFVRPPPVLV
jgi:hypothetical protein